MPFLDLHAGYMELKESLDRAYHRVMASGRYILGDEVDAFEEEWARYCGTRYCVAVGNGLDALHLSLRAMGVSPGDEVIVPSNTYIATWLAVSHAGATPVPVEPNRATYNLKPGAVEAAITDRTRVVLPVHLYGQPADISSLEGIAKTHNLLLLEDAAQAHGALHRRRRTGGLCDAAAWSFYPTKNLGAFGDAGAVTTDTRQIAERVRSLRNYGSRERNENELQGFNSRMDPLQAAFLRVLLSVLDERNNRRRELAAIYREHLRDIADLTLPAVDPQTRPVWHQFVVRHPHRDGLRHHLEKHGIGTLIHYPVPPHRSSAYSATHGALNLPVAEELAQTVLSLPIHPHLGSEHLKHVFSAVRQYTQPTN